jgi:membrane-bound lytic murein transglycosylase A
VIRIGNWSRPARPKTSALVASILAPALLLAACAIPPAVRDAVEKAREEKPKVATFHPVAFSALPGWTADNHAAALAAFKASCKVITARDPAKEMGGHQAYGVSQQWRGVCAAASANKRDAKTFFEANFLPFEVHSDGEPVGLFTGYYEPELQGARHRHGKFQTPLYSRPRDLVLVDLGDFRDQFKGERISGRVEDGRLKPYADRAEIVGKGLSSVASPLVYVDDPWEAFSLQIQGSGRVRLPDGKLIRMNYDGQNGHPYTAIGRELVRRGAIRREDVSMQAIRAWLKANPKQADSVMNLNASYVFFKEEAGGDPLQGAPGAMKVPLHPERSVAIDLRYHALGAPLWIDATRPADKDGETPETFQHLLIAHDTGGAIRGPVRGDVYWGAGARPEELAGRMANRGRLIALLPRELAAKAAAGN